MRRPSWSPSADPELRGVPRSRTQSGGVCLRKAVPDATTHWTLPPGVVKRDLVVVGSALLGVGDDWVGLGGCLVITTLAGIRVRYRRTEPGACALPSCGDGTAVGWIACVAGVGVDLRGGDGGVQGC